MAQQVEYAVEASVNRNRKDVSSAELLFERLLSRRVRTILVRGEPGTGKTTLAIDLLTQYGRGTYVSTRVSEEQLSLQNHNVQDLVEKGQIKEVNLQSIHAGGSKLDFADFRLASVEDILQTVLTSATDSHIEPLIVLDSWDTIAKKLDPLERMKIEQSLLVIAEANHSKLLFVSEENALTSTDYIVDAVVQLDDTIFQGRRLRQIIWKKLRGSSIPQRSYLYSLAGGRFNVLEDSFVPWPESINPELFQSVPDGPFYYSSGSVDLDQFLGGGFRRGSLVLLELGAHLGDYWHVPIARSLEVNFIANGGCSLVMPLGNFPADMVKEEFAKLFDEKVLRKSLRIAHKDARKSDPCFMRLPNSSVRAMTAVVSRNTKIMKGEQNRPCFYFVGSDMIEGVLGNVASSKAFVPMFAQWMKSSGDLTLTAMREGSPIACELMNACDVHLKLEDVDNTLLLYSIKPRSELYHVKYDYAQGCPKVCLVPVV